MIESQGLHQGKKIFQQRNGGRIGKVWWPGGNHGHHLRSRALWEFTSQFYFLGFNQIHEQLEITSHNIGLCMDRACIVATDLIQSDSFLNPMIQFRNSWLDYLSFCYQQNGSNIPISKGGTCYEISVFVKCCQQKRRNSKSGSIGLILSTSAHTFFMCVLLGNFACGFHHFPPFP